MNADSASPSADDQLPIISLEGLYSGDRARWREIADQITQASRGLGFFYIVDHGIERERVQELFDLARRFFELPMAEKDKIAIYRNDQYRGYLPMQMMGADPALKGNLHEAFQIHRELPPDDPDYLAGKPMHSPNIWPESMPELKQAMLAYYDRLDSLAHTFLRMYATGLDLPEDAFTRFFRKSMMQMRIMHYPPQDPGTEQERLGVRPHTDSGGFTFLAQDDVGGLQALNRRGDWVDVKPVPGSFVINIGEMMKVWTDGVLSATPHRVINLTGKERYSMPFFATPDFDATIYPLIKNPEESTVEPKFATSVERGEPITCGQILSKLYARIWPTTKVQRSDAPQTPAAV